MCARCRCFGWHRWCANIMGSNGKIPNSQFLTYRPQAFSGEQVIEKIDLFSWESRLWGPREQNGINKKWILGHFTQVKLYFSFLTCQYKKCVSVPPWWRPCCRGIPRAEPFPMSQFLGLKTTFHGISDLRWHILRSDLPFTVYRPKSLIPAENMNLNLLQTGLSLKTSLSLYPALTLTKYFFSKDQTYHIASSARKRATWFTNMCPKIGVCHLSQ